MLYNMTGKGVYITKYNQLSSITIQRYHDMIYIIWYKFFHEIDLKFMIEYIYSVGWSHICSNVFWEWAVCMHMYFETPSILIPLLTDFVVAVFPSNHTYTLLSRYEYCYITITIVNFISIYQYIVYITSDRKLALLLADRNWEKPDLIIKSLVTWR